MQVPYQTNKSALVEKIADLVESKVLCRQKVVLFVYSKWSYVKLLGLQHA